MDSDLSRSSVERLYSYYLLAVHARSLGRTHVSSRELAENLAIGDTQVRKDMNAIRLSGQPKHGYRVDEAIVALRNAMGIDHKHPTVVCGVGKLGRALLEYSRFSEFGFKVIAAFDHQRELIGQQAGEVKIDDIVNLESVVRKARVEIGVITVNVWAAQEICDRLVKAGVRTIWNFAPLQLKVPAHVLVRDEDFAGSLTVIAHYLKNTSPPPRR